MPKRVDHDARRREIADALMRLAAHQGLEAVSLRQVAAEAGVSTGMVQHYFRTKDEMMRFALGMVMERIQARTAGTPGSSSSPREAVRALLHQILPLDDTRRLEGHVGLAFLAYAAVRPGVTEGLRDSAGQLRQFLADQIQAGRADYAGPEESPNGRQAEPALAATTLLALVDGLGIQVLGQQCSPQQAVAALDSYLDVVFGSAPGTPSDHRDHIAGTR